jgi:hypothetical protein
MKQIPDTLTQLAFNKKENEPLTNEELAVCEEWTSGKGLELMKISSEDPQLLVCMGLYDKLEEKKVDVWSKVISYQPRDETIRAQSNLKIFLCKLLLKIKTMAVCRKRQ